MNKYIRDQPQKSTLVFTDDAPQKCTEIYLSLPLLPNQMSSCVLTRGIHIPLDLHLSLAKVSGRPEFLMGFLEVKKPHP